MIAAPRYTYNRRKHCFTPCPENICDCGRSAGIRQGRRTAEELRRLVEERRAALVQQLLAQGKDAEALAAALE